MLIIACAFIVMAFVLKDGFSPTYIQDGVDPFPPVYATSVALRLVLGILMAAAILRFMRYALAWRLAIIGGLALIGAVFEMSGWVRHAHAIESTEGKLYAFTFLAVVLSGIVFATRHLLRIRGRVGARMSRRAAALLLLLLGTACAVSQLPPDSLRRPWSATSCPDGPIAPADTLHGPMFFACQVSRSAARSPDSLPARWTPALRRGRAVRQLVVHEYLFRLHSPRVSACAATVDARHQSLVCAVNLSHIRNVCSSHRVCRTDTIP